MRRRIRMISFIKEVLGINKMKRERKYGFVTGMDYVLFSPQEKLEYHEYEGDVAERLHFQMSLADMVREKNTTLFLKEDSISSFKLSEETKNLSNSDRIDLIMRCPKLVWKGDKAYTLRSSSERIGAHMFYICSKCSKISKVGFMDGLTPIPINYREDISLERFDKIFHEYLCGEDKCNGGVYRIKEEVLII